MFQPGQNLYSSNVGLTNNSQNLIHYDQRAPNTTDTLYTIGTQWCYPANGLWSLNALSSANNVLSATWIQLASSSGDIVAVNGTAPIVVSTSANTATVSITGPSNVTTLTAHGVVIGEGTSAVTATTAGSANQVLQSGGASADPTWSTATYPATTTANQLLYSSATNTVGGLSSANNGVLSTGTTGIPVITALANGQTLVGQGASSSPAAVYFSNSKVTYVPKFTAIPIASASTGGVAAVTVNTTNVWSYPQWGAYFEQYNTVASSIIVPTLSATAGSGLNIGSLTGANAKIIEITEGNNVNTKNAFTTGSSAGFYVQAQFIIPTLNTVQNLAVGFRIVQTYQGTSLPTYTEYALIGVLGTTGEFEIQTQKASGGEVDTDTTQAATAATLFTLRVNVSSGGVVTYAINGAPPTVTAAFTFTASTLVIPMIYLAEAAGAHGECDLVSYQCGFA